MDVGLTCSDWGVSPDRISMPEGSVKHFQNIARRLYRIFAHAYYHHRELFEEFEVSCHHDQLLLCGLWVETYQRIPLGSLPRCAGRMEHPAGTIDERVDHYRL